MKTSMKTSPFAVLIIVFIILASGCTNNIETPDNSPLSAGGSDQQTPGGEGVTTPSGGTTDPSIPAAGGPQEPTRDWVIEKEFTYCFNDTEASGQINVIVSNYGNTDIPWTDWKVLTIDGEPQSVFPYNISNISSNRNFGPVIMGRTSYPAGNHVIVVGKSADDTQTYQVTCERPARNATNCIDSDYGIKEGIYGYLVKGDQVSRDACVISSEGGANSSDIIVSDCQSSGYPLSMCYVLENYCRASETGGDFASVKKPCPNGCSGGACK